jgi:tetratricopeptide (TPR) repeat protein
MAESVHPLVLRAREAFARSEIKSAEQAVEERLKTAGRDINALEVRYQIQKHRGQVGEAARTLDAVIGINSRADWAHNELIRLLLAHGKTADAEQVTRAALRANPGNAQAHNLFGTLISDSGDLLAGEWHLRRSLETLETREPQAPILVNLGNNLTRQGRLDEAKRYFDRARDLSPNGVQMPVPEALDDARGSRRSAEEALATLDAAKELKGEEQLARGRLHDSLGHYDEAWQDCVAGKRKLASEAGGLQYKADAIEALFGRFKQFFTREYMSRMPRAKQRTDVPQPIFIVGPPRSGAIVVDRILRSHSSVPAGGGLPFLAELRKIATDVLPSPQPYPENLAQSWTADRYFSAALFRDYYFARAERFGLLNGGGKAFFTDRMPFNELHLPLLKMAFPQAKIVYVMRHPLDVSVSLLANNFTQGFNCGYRIEDVMHHLAATFDLFEHYRRELDLGEYVLKYEALVADQAGETRKLLDYLGLPFEEACLRFHEQRRQGPTPGAARPISSLNSQSVNRHRHYTQHLKPYVSRVRPLMAAYGYE